MSDPLLASWFGWWLGLVVLVAGLGAWCAHWLGGQRAAA